MFGSRPINNETLRTVTHSNCFRSAAAAFFLSNYFWLVALVIESVVLCVRLNNNDDDSIVVVVVVVVVVVTRKRSSELGVCPMPCISNMTTSACAVSALIVLPVANLLSKMDSATSISYMTWNF